MATVTDLSSGATAYGISANPAARHYQEAYVNGNASTRDSIRQLLEVPLYRAEQSEYFSALDREYNAEQAQKSRDWQERMSNTAYQRAVADMKKAGINPLMAFQQGGASSPSGSTASSSSHFSQNSNLISTIAAGMLQLLSGLVFHAGTTTTTTVKGKGLSQSTTKRSFR